MVYAHDAFGRRFWVRHRFSGSVADEGKWGFDFAIRRARFRLGSGGGEDSGVAR